MGVATRRAAHQLMDSPRILDDPLALTILGAEEEATLRAELGKHRGRLTRAIRAFVVARSRFAEDELARAIARKTAQCVILGAGLDTFAYRNPHENLRVFEVDYPATQAWKRRKLETAAIAIPNSLTFAPVDFERQTLAEGLRLAGFDPAAPTFFSWLGVSMYLTDDAITSTLALIASTPSGGGLVFDYAVPRESLGWIARIAHDAFARRVAAAGEPFRSYFEPRELRARLEALGFNSIDDLGSSELNARYFQARSDGLEVGGTLGRLLRARL
jgi:methyltransferase (TIGR00027 family)